jgi:hypothetical protein
MEVNLEIAFPDDFISDRNPQRGYPLDQFAPRISARSVNLGLKTVAVRGVEQPLAEGNLRFLPWQGKNPRRLFREHAQNPAPQFHCC